MSEISCLYCEFSIQITDSVLKCTQCNKSAHITCLKRPGTPGDLIGDVFFNFTCIFCTNDGKEDFQRPKMSWAVATVLSIHNLSITSTGLGHHGYFHWKTHIGNFIDKNWNHFFGQTKNRRNKRWLGSLAGCLSTNCPELFTSGQQTLHEQGWWKLSYKMTPRLFSDLFHKMKNVRRSIEENSDSSDDDSDHAKKRRPNSDNTFGCCRLIPYMGCTPWHLKVNVKQEPILETEDNSSPVNDQIHASLMDFLESNFSTDTLLENELSLTNNHPDFLDDLNLMSLNQNDSEWQNMFSSNVDNLTEEIIQPDPVPTFEPRIIQVTNYQEEDDGDDDDDDEDDKSGLQISTLSNTIFKKEISSDNEASTCSDLLTQCEKSLFTVTEKRPLPWLNNNIKSENQCDENPDNLTLLSEYEESEMFRSLKSVIEMDGIEIPPWIRRLYRKIVVRMKKREILKPTFDIDSKKRAHNNVKGHPLLNRFYQTNWLKRADEQPLSWQVRFSGLIECEMFVSPYTRRILHPFIYRDMKCMPPRVKLMCELQYKVNEVKPSRSSIDYCYVRPQHIAAINSLLQQYFWPGIDMSECLSYPDFSIVAIYKNLIVGCAFLVPDVDHNEAYISFMVVRDGWRHSGIASFMLYHLTQTCMGKDITLHVSGTNPAICFYQKFGFKMEEVILDFYEKYLPSDALTKSRHAYFLRMSR